MESKTHSWSYHDPSYLSTLFSQRCWSTLYLVAKLILHVYKLDMFMPNSNTTRAIFTDLGVTLDLKATETDNSIIDNHAVICIFFVLTNWRPVDFYNTSKERMDETIINDCDKWIVFGDTLSKGKKNENVFHNVCLSHLINFYDKEREQ